MSDEFSGLWNPKDDAGSSSEEEEATPTFRNVFARTVSSDGYFNYAHTIDDTVDTTDEYLFPIRDPTNRTDDTTTQRVSLKDDDSEAKAEFMATSNPRVYRRSQSADPYCKSASKKTYISLSSMSPENRQSCKEESSLDAETAQTMVSEAAEGGVRIRRQPAVRSFAPNRYSSSRASDAKLSLEASGSRDSTEPSVDSGRSSTSFSTDTTLSDEQRKNRGTITPALDQYYRNRPTAIVVENPAPSDRENSDLVSNEAVDSGHRNPPEEERQGPAESPELNGCMERYYDITRKIVNTPCMFVVYLMLCCWSFYCMYGGLKYMKHCPTMDTIPIIFVFLGLTSAFAFITRMMHIAVHRSPAYGSIANIVQCLQAVMFLGYFFIYLLELTSFFALKVNDSPEECEYEYHGFAFWNICVQSPVIVILFILHLPSVIKSKWYCATPERN